MLGLMILEDLSTTTPPWYVNAFGDFIRNFVI